MAQLAKHKRFQQSFELSKGDVWLPKLFRQTVPQCWPGGVKTAVTKLAAWPLKWSYSQPFQSILLMKVFYSQPVIPWMDASYSSKVKISYRQPGFTTAYNQWYFLHVKHSPMPKTRLPGEWTLQPFWLCTNADNDDL